MDAPLARPHFAALLRIWQAARLPPLPIGYIDPVGPCSLEFCSIVKAFMLARLSLYPFYTS